MGSCAVVGVGFHRRPWVAASGCRAGAELGCWPGRTLGYRLSARYRPQFCPPLCPLWTLVPVFLLGREHGFLGHVSWSGFGGWGFVPTCKHWITLSAE